MVEESRAVEQHFEQDHGARGWADQVHKPDLEQHRERDFDRVKADRGGDIHVEIRVMDPVQAPQ